jgi:beta propeller repeat protein
MVLLALTLGIPAAAGAVEAQSWQPWMSMREIAQNPSLLFLGSSSEWSSPDIDGEYAVFQQRLKDADGAGPGVAPGDWNIYAYNLSTRVKTAVTTAAGDQTNPRISGDWVVYVDSAAGNDDVKAFQLSTGVTKVVASGAGNQNAPDISDMSVVYENQTPSEVRMFDLATNADTLVQAAAISPSVSGKRVVFIHQNEVKFKDMVDGVVRNVTNNGATAEYLPRIDGDRIVFLQMAGFLDTDVIGYTISTNSLKTIQTAGTSFAFPADVSDTKTVYTVFDGGAWFLRAYDFATDKAVTIADTSPTNLTLPAVSGNRVVFVSGSDGLNGEIHLGVLAAPVLSLDVPSVDKYGAVPKLTGKLTDNGTNLGNKNIDILSSADGGHTWTKVASVTTLSDGSFSYLAAKVFRKTWFRAAFNGETEGLLLFSQTLSRFSALSSVMSITPKASIGKPSGYPLTGRRTKTYSVYGPLKPQQAVTPASSKVVVIKAYRLQKGKYVLRRTFSAKVYNYSTYSRYKASVKLPYTGKWRIRAYFQGSPTNAAMNSTYRYVKVQ